MSEQSKLCSDMERITGVEPAYAAWEAAVLPMNYIRVWCVLYQTRPRFATRNPATTFRIFPPFSRAKPLCSRSGFFKRLLLAYFSDARPLISHTCVYLYQFPLVIVSFFCKKREKPQFLLQFLLYFLSRVYIMNPIKGSHFFSNDGGFHS